MNGLSAPQYIWRVEGLKETKKKKKRTRRARITDLSDIHLDRGWLRLFGGDSEASARGTRSFIAAGCVDKATSFMPCDRSPLFREQAMMMNSYNPILMHINRIRIRFTIRPLSGIRKVTEDNENKRKDFSPRPSMRSKAKMRDSCLFSLPRNKTQSKRML